MTLLADTLTAAAITATPMLALADAGYWSEANATAPGPDRLIATMKDHKQRRAARDLGQTTGPPPANATPADAMEHRLRTPAGAAAYAKRSRTIEPVFADRKHNRAMRSFRRRGIDAANSEWAFMHLAANMLKLRQHRAAAAAFGPPDRHTDAPDTRPHPGLKRPRSRTTRPIRPCTHQPHVLRQPAERDKSPPPPQPSCSVGRTSSSLTAMWRGRVTM